MNKQLINKYKPEFDHWLNGGKLLYKRLNSNAWWNSEPWDYSPDYVTAIIISDEYVEFRKALAEGKTVQANVNYWSFPETEEFNWQDIASPDSFNKFNLLNLRIKPDEPKFKVGDFVRYVPAHALGALEINNINGNRYYFTNSEMSCVEHELEPWTPVKDEWCWFYDSKSGKSAALAQFKEINNDYFISITNTSWKYCEPFLNSLPSYLKDK